MTFLVKAGQLAIEYLGLGILASGGGIIALLFVKDYFQNHSEDKYLLPLIIAFGIIGIFLLGVGVESLLQLV